MTVTDRPGSAASDEPLETTLDDFLGGALKVHQPKHGYRAGLDAILLAATVPGDVGEQYEVLDCGAGVGTVGLAVARRCAAARVTLVERDVDLARLAHRNIDENGLRERVRILTSDITSRGVDWPAMGLQDNGFSYVVCNPPFQFDVDGTASPQHLKARSHAFSEADFAQWIKFITRMTAPRGRLTMIHRADGLPRLLAVLEGRFGGITVRPIYPRSNQPANRVIVSGLKGSRATLTLAPGFVLHSEGNQFTQAANDILRHGAALSLGL